MFPNMKEKIQTEMQELLNEKTVGMDQLARLMPAVPARNGEHQTTAA
jgi:hypothetical protein